jgi:hypothetical protein
MERSPVDRPHDLEAGAPGLATCKELVRSGAQGGEEGALLKLCEMWGGGAQHANRSGCSDLSAQSTCARMMAVSRIVIAPEMAQEAEAAAAASLINMGSCALGAPRDGESARGMSLSRKEAGQRPETTCLWLRCGLWKAQAQGCTHFPDSAGPQHDFRPDVAMQLHKPRPNVPERGKAPIRAHKHRRALKAGTGCSFSKSLC